jgi:Capsule biosynthesis CapC
MFESLNTPEITRLALLIGAFVAIQYKNISGINPGGVIVPGFILILFLISPLWCISSLALSFLIYFFYKAFLDKANYKRRTPMYILSFLSLATANLLGYMYIQLNWLQPSIDNLSGTLLPAVIAFTFTKQKMGLVVKGVVITTLITASFLTLIYLIGYYGFNIDFDTLRPLYAGKETLSLKFSLMQFYVGLVVSFIIYYYRDVRSGGYMVAPVAAGLLIQPLSAIFFLLGCIFVYFVTQLICQFTLIIGLKRYVIALFLSTMFVWTTEILFLHINSTILPFQGSSLFAIIAIMSYANDSILYHKQKILLHISLNTLVALISFFVATLLSKVLV